MRRLPTLLLAPVLLIVLTHTAMAQESPWQIEARAGAALPVDDLGDVELDPGISLSATVAYRFTDALAVYGGRGWHLLGADEVEATPDGAVERTGCVLGLAFENPLGATGESTGRRSQYFTPSPRLQYASSSSLAEVSPST